MSSWLDAAADLAAVQDTPSLHAQILELARREPETHHATLFIEGSDGELSAIGSVPPSLPQDAFPEGEAISVDGWRLIPLTAQGMRVGVLALQREEGPSEVEQLALHIAAALNAASTYAMLEQLVQQEMATAIAREQAIQLILDNMGEGLMVIDFEGHATPVRSLTVAQWLGEIPETGPIWGWLAQDEALTEQFATAFQQIAWDQLPFEVTSAQMPHRIRRGSRTFHVGYSQVFEGGVFAKVLVSIQDITAQLQAEKDEAARRELEQVVRTLLANVVGFRDGLKEMQRLIQQLAEIQDSRTRSRVLHTIKGNAAILGFVSFPNEIHQIEDILADDPDRWDPSLLERVQRSWAQAFDFVRPLVSAEDGEITLNLDEYKAFIRLLERHRVAAPILDSVRAWSCPSLQGTLERYRKLVRRYCERTGKRVRCEFQGGAVRIRSEEQGDAISAVVHLLRNALEHGFETPEERQAVGKMPEGRLTFEAVDLGRSIQISIEDDGRGIDISAIREVARQAGLPRDASVLECLCAGSTLEAANLDAGRGVGMAAVRDAVVHLGGTIRVQTAPGRGTRIVMDLPTPVAPLVA